MSAPAGSKRAAPTPFASPSKAASKRSRTHYDYGDEDDVESLPEDQWSPGDADSMSLDDGEDGDEIPETRPRPCGEFTSASSEAGSEDGTGFMCSEPRYQKDRKVTGVRVPRVRAFASSADVLTTDLD